MRRSQSGNSNWVVVAALAANVTALAAVVMAVMTFWFVRQETQRVVFNTALDSLWHLDAQWNSDSMIDARSAAAAALLDGQHTREVDAVLDFFDQTALFLGRGALDEEMVWYQFYRPMAHYWFASQDYVRQVQRGDPTRWQQLASAMPRLVAIEAQRGKRSVGDAVPTSAQIREFLRTESEGDECEDRSAETRKTPL